MRADTLAGKIKTSYLKNFNFLTPEIPFPAWRRTNRNPRKFRLAHCLPLLILMLLACGQEESNTGVYRANLVFPEDIPQIEETSNINCVGAGIKNIVFNFIVNGKQYGPSSFDCEKRNAVITGVPAGSGITVEVFADDENDNAILEGSEIIDIPKDKVVTGGTIQMRYVSPVPITDPDTENFDGTWKVTEYPDGCVRINRFTGIIEQTGELATLSAVPDLWPDLTISPDEYCTVSGNQLSCPPFRFTDNEGRIISYTKYILRYMADRDKLIGENEWTIYTLNDTVYCTGTSILDGVRDESAGASEE